MEINENLVEEQQNVSVPENTEPPAEQSNEPEKQQKIYTQDEFDAAVGKKKSRWEAKRNRDEERRNEKHNAIMSILKAGTGKETEEDIIEYLKEFYGKQGAAVTPTSPPGYSEKETAILAESEAREIIQAGAEEVAEELERLAALGPDRMTPREKEVFRHLAAHKNAEARTAQLRSLGIPREVYESQEFQSFAGLFNASTPARTIFDLYQKQQPKNQVETVGSVKNTGTPENGVKDFYTPEEARKFTVDDYNKNPELWKKVNESRLHWK